AAARPTIVPLLRSRLGCPGRCETAASGTGTRRSRCGGRRCSGPLPAGCRSGPRLTHTEAYPTTLIVYLSNADPYHLAHLHDVLDAFDVTARTELRDMDKAVNAAKIDKRAELSDAGNLAFTPLADNQTGEGLAATAIPLLARNE